MPENPSEALANALDDIERRRRRCLLVTRILIYPSVVFFAASVVTLLFSSNKWLGMTWGIISLWSLIAALGVDVGKATLASTQLILKAIEARPANQAPPAS
jgi:hypothetical protein